MIYIIELLKLDRAGEFSYDDETVMSYLSLSYNDAKKDFDSLKTIIKKAYKDDTSIAYEEEKESDNGCRNFYYLHDERFSKGAYVRIYEEEVFTHPYIDEADLIESLKYEEGR